METCANCERKIGNLEAAHIHGDNIVCEACRKSLQSPSNHQPGTRHKRFLRVAVLAVGALIVAAGFYGWQRLDHYKGQGAAASIAATTQSTQPARVPRVRFEWGDPVGSFSAVNAGRVTAGGMEVDAQEWNSLDAVQRKRVADMLWDERVDTLKAKAKTDIYLIEDEGRLNAQRSSINRDQFGIIAANYAAEMAVISRQERLQKDVGKLEIRITDSATSKVIAKRTSAGFSASD